MAKTIEEKTVKQISTVSILANFLLSIFKFFAGIFGHSEALVSDSIHSLSDVFSTIIVIIGIRIAGKAPDKHHQYGHERFESVTAILLAIILAMTGIGIGLNGFNKITTQSYLDSQMPTLIALIAAITSIVIKESMYWYTKIGATKINSGALMADAWHHRSDALSSVGSLVGIIGSQNGYAILDPIATLVICVFILKAAFDIFKDGINKMVDASISNKDIDHIRKEVMEVDGVIDIDLLKSRQFGNKCYIDVEIAVQADLPLIEAHEIAASVHHNIEEKFPNVKHCMVHVNPYLK
ncbi:MAG: cation diffusion facilitator family transporter [Sphaerochaetaceae bacterium]|nr:cation diffusion facilitator family transporter [Sphaerochaetaceae bacterium]MDC7236323.1 cation diffusion facilitator family transporter [Sphaerochaetaceae bacterium]MDC7249327.1 cation diffusion facilitator family transporter [Sphaerochaetaceae bacterium]